MDLHSLKQLIKDMNKFLIIPVLLKGTKFFKVTSTKQKKDVYDVFFSATQMRSFIEISPIILQGLVLDEHYELWLDHMSADVAWKKWHISEQEIEEAQEAIDLWMEVQATIS